MKHRSGFTAVFRIPADRLQTSCDTIRICADLRKLRAVTSPLTSSVVDGQDRLREDLINRLSFLPAFTSQMVENSMERALQDHTAQIQAATIKLLAYQDTRLDAVIRRPPKLRRHAQSQSSKSRQRKINAHKIEGLTINVSQYASACSKACVCSCHMQMKAPMPAILNRVLGHLFVGTAGLPIIGTKCDYHACKSTIAPRLSVEYWFPLGFFWSQIVRLQVGYNVSMGPQFSLRSLRRVPDSALCVHYAMEGNIEGLKGLFSRGLASPWDVSSTCGYTLSRVSNR